MLTSDEIRQAAERLDIAERTRVQTELLSLKYPHMTMDDAYGVQAAWVKKKIAAGRKPIGWKIGLTSKAMQYALNIDTPDSGVLFDDMLFEDGATVPADRFIQPRIEAEIAFVMKAPLKGPGISIFDVLNATDYVTPALEILDTRILRADPGTKKARTIVDTISDNAANAGIVTGGRAVKPDQIDMRWMGAIVSRNAEVEETGLGAGVLNQPSRGVAWLANRLAQYGDGIDAGQIVLAGSFIRPIEARHGDTIVADFGPYGSVSLFFA
ncbi:MULTISPECIES: 2-oxo-hept-4-ene-1,7-dioate hydratase [unclassified Rhizobium]|uniref:2-oxo-hept-4-ene-1,7-dioate hydratase n=1 Tax=unclassified Rhizobium TaxID=2613769 RepID=UPI001A9A20B1|nr:MULTISPECIES: 2-oxo-hepta-3-ene-1,7-dioic acid hydratase [unclassified Rhizobium]MBX5156340.1 2-oxo-hepta-3-ene-1,7-dioic acid hydratase [Rhizobium sp. NZLR8]MBX5162469.1 2-oxo-hepta-3-ene-1,7-dioic acid hydratase [Rhizobium sp. NZLR4b]MBX5173971.1 2-oxo-hepta-3-ene-1,7-dioic acid hydratase [Rhizobium sp. NZLR1b]MBX5185532.1 2-oxo-hepta-3-ene-1,7-dioic acid hydratase [Rhizobium sp. NZLR5]MBX5187323.1 2-oxo-hepta-3-ene-1,7-dioic acid hydratase [Rhizobium sp. NZLR3b]